MAVSQFIKFHLILLYFQRYAPDKFNIAKIRKGNNSINTDDRVIVLAFCTSPYSPLSLYQVSFIYFQYSLRYAPDKLTFAKIRKEGNSVITCDRVTILALCTSSDGHISMYHLIPFNTFRDMLLTSFSLQKLRREVTPSILVIGLWFLHSEFPLWLSISVSSFIYLSSILLEICSG